MSSLQVLRSSQGRDNNLIDNPVLKVVLLYHYCLYSRLFPGVVVGIKGSYILKYLTYTLNKCSVIGSVLMN